MKQSKLLVALVALTITIGFVVEIAFAQHDLAQGNVLAQNNEIVDVFENIEFRFLLLGIATGLVYALLGWIASGEEFEPQKFLRTFAIITLVALGLDLSNMTFDVYSAMLEPMAITIFLEKLLNSASRKKTKS